MANEVAVINPGAVQEWSRERVELLKRTICKGATDDEFQIFIEVAKRTGLNPFARQVHAVKRFNKKTGRDEMSIQTGIDGYRLIADRTGKYAGSDDPTFDNEKEPNRATVTVYKMVEGQRCPFTATARWDEYYPGDAQGFMWKKMPCVMLSKCAEALALRKAFPAELSGLYTNEEMEQADRGGVRAEQPGPDDGNQGTLEWKFDFGKFKDRTVEQVYAEPKWGPNALKSYIKYLEDDAAKNKKDLSPRAQEAISHIETFLGVMENGAATQEPGSQE